MRLSRRLSVIVGVVHAGCGGSTPDDGCPRTETLRSFSRTLTHDELCAVQRGTYTGGCPVEGRRFDGYASVSVCAADAPAVARYFASCAHLEAASVVAFDRLADELTFHGAPRDLVEACRAAAREEIEHVASVGALARSFGAEPASLFSDEAPEPRALVDIAIENAVEGMVREVFGAAQAQWRAARASDVRVREAMHSIADDESRHAELSSRISEFLASKLDAASRERVRAAFEAACADLRWELSCAEVDPSLVTIAGVPSRENALMLFDALEREIWLAV